MANVRHFKAHVAFLNSYIVDFWPCLLASRGVQPNPEPDQPEQPARTRTGNRPNRPLRRSVTGFCAQDPTPAGRVAGFLLQNPSHPTRPTLYTIWQYARRSKQDLVRSGDIQARFGEIRRHLRRSKRDLDHIW